MSIFHTLPKLPSDNLSGTFINDFSLSIIFFDVVISLKLLSIDVSLKLFSIDISLKLFSIDVLLKFFFQKNLCYLVVYFLK